MRDAILRVPRDVQRRPRRWVLTSAALALVTTGVLGLQVWLRSPLEAAVRFEVRLAEETPAPGLRETTVSDSSRTIYLHRDAVVTNGDIARAQVTQDGSIAVTFNADGAGKMFQASRSHLGRPLAILIDGEVVMALVVKAPINGSALITGDFTRVEADRIVAGIVGR